MFKHLLPCITIIFLVLIIYQYISVILITFWTFSLSTKLICYFITWLPFVSPINDLYNILNKIFSVWRLLTNLKKANLLKSNLMSTIQVVTYWHLSRCDSFMNTVFFPIILSLTPSTSPHHLLLTSSSSLFFNFPEMRRHRSSE